MEIRHHKKTYAGSEKRKHVSLEDFLSAMREVLVARETGTSFFPAAHLPEMDSRCDHRECLITSILLVQTLDEITVLLAN